MTLKRMGGLVTPHAHEPDESSESLETALLVVLMDSSFRNPTPPPIEFPKIDTAPYPSPYFSPPQEFSSSSTSPTYTRRSILVILLFVDDLYLVLLRLF